MKFQLMKQAVLGPNVPAVVFENLYSARENDLKVILYVLQKGEINPQDISNKLQISLTAINSSLLFWTDKGLILCEETFSEKPKKKKMLSSREILNIARENPEVEVLVNHLQKIYGQAINETGTNKYLNLLLQENIPAEVILVLATHLAPAQKGPAYTARVIQNLYEKEGITSAEKAEEYIRTLEKREALYRKVCKIFALEQSKLTNSEKTMINAWSERLNMSADMIEAAYSSAGPNASIRYCNGILKSWSQKKYRTPTDIQEEFVRAHTTGRNIDRDDDLILKGMTIVPVFEKGE
ncbi:MAG: DnaD domain protein [Oscillospiraceae bacterium]|nr:DnaD domain protein [Oscillospiraceae bacterium]